MDFHGALRWLQATPIGAIADGNPYIVTVCLVVHFIGLCLLVGAMLIVDLRILGVYRQAPLASVFRLLPVAITGFCLNALSGFILFAARPVNYWDNPAFQIKLALLLVSGLNALFFTVFEHRVMAAVPDGLRTPLLAKVSAGGSLLLWFTIIFFGRLIAFQVAA